MMLRRERHKLLLLASDAAGLAMVPENQAETKDKAHKTQCSFHARRTDTLGRTGGPVASESTTTAVSNCTRITILYHLRFAGMLRSKKKKCNKNKNRSKK